MPDLPPVKFAKVVGRFVAAIADGPDVDDTPDFVPLTGNVTFTPRVSALKVPTATPAPTTVLPVPITVQLDQFGYLTWRGKRGVYLVSPTTAVNPHSWNYTVSFDLKLDGFSIPYAAFAIEAPEYIPGPNPTDPDTDSVGLVDLTLAAPIPGSPGVVDTSNFVVNLGGITGIKRVTEAEYAALVLADAVDLEVLYVGFPPGGGGGGLIDGGGP